MTKKFEDILNGVNNEILNEDSKKAIVEAFETAVADRAKIEVETALKKLDESHAEQLQKLLESIDEDHVDKFKKVVAKIDSDYAEKLNQVVEKYEGMLKTEAVTFRDKLTTELSNYMDLYLEKMIPTEQIQEAVVNTQSKKIINKVKELVSVDEDSISDTIRDALEDGKNRIDSLSQELSEAIKTNIQINQDLKKTKTMLMLEQKTEHFDDSKKRYVMRVLNQKSPEDIEANFDYVVEMFERDEADEAKVLTEVATKAAKSTKIDTPPAMKEEIIEESAPVSRMEQSVGGYLNALQEQDGK